MTTEAPPIERLREALKGIGVIAEALIDGALKNRDVQTYIRDLTPWHGVPGLWSVDVVRRNPPVRVEFEGGYVFGSVGESIAAGANKKSFGQLIGVFPLDVDDPVGEVQILYVWKDDNPRQRRFVQRARLKKRLGKRWRKLVEEAMARPKARFIAEVVTPDAAHVLRLRLGVDAGQFWRIARGREWFTFPSDEARQLTLDMAGAEERPAAERPARTRRPKVKVADNTPSLFGDGPEGE